MTDRPAPVDHTVHDLVRDRWSPRAFADRPVSEEDLNSVLEAARWTPSCYNEQPWLFFVATRDEKQAYQDLLDCLVPFNQTWAATAPVLIVAAARTKFAMNGKDNAYALYDLGAAAAQLTLQATALGLATHTMGGFDADTAREKLSLPDDVVAVSAIALGYPGSPDRLPEDLREGESAPRSRKPLADIVVRGGYGRRAAE